MSLKTLRFVCEQLTPTLGVLVHSEGKPRGKNKYVGNLHMNAYYIGNIIKELRLFFINLGCCH